MAVAVKTLDSLSRPSPEFDLFGVSAQLSATVIHVTPSSQFEAISMHSNSSLSRP